MQAMKNFTMKCYAMNHFQVCLVFWNMTLILGIRSRNIESLYWISVNWWKLCLLRVVPSCLIWLCLPIGWSISGSVSCFHTLMIMALGLQAASSEIITKRYSIKSSVPRKRSSSILSMISSGFRMSGPSNCYGSSSELPGFTICLKYISKLLNEIPSKSSSELWEICWLPVNSLRVLEAARRKENLKNLKKLSRPVSRSWNNFYSMSLSISETTWILRER